MVLWGIWRERCGGIFEGRRSGAEVMVAGMRGFYREFADAVERGESRLLVQNGGLLRWSSPAAGRLRVRTMLLFGED